MLTTPLNFIPRRRPRHRKRQEVPPVPTLVAATYDVTSSVTLTFDQPIDISQINGPAISVNDFINSMTFTGLDGPATRVDPFTVGIEVEEEGPFAGSTTTLNATNDTRIRSIPGAKEWAGVTDLPLPYP